MGFMSRWSYVDTGEFIVSIPYSLHGGKIHGLCGNCNNRPEDDFLTVAGVLLVDEEEFVDSWDVKANEKEQEEAVEEAAGVSTSSPVIDIVYGGDTRTTIFPAHLIRDQQEERSTATRPLAEYTG